MNVGGKAVIKCIAGNYRQEILSFHCLRSHIDRNTLAIISVWQLCKLIHIFELSTYPLPKVLIILYQDPLNSCSGMNFHLCACIKAQVPVFWNAAFKIMSQGFFYQLLYTEPHFILIKIKHNQKYLKGSVNRLNVAKGDPLFHHKCFSLFFLFLTKELSAGMQNIILFELLCEDFTFFFLCNIN